MPKISVLIPLYNTKESHLRAAIESVLNQTYKDFECILLNNSPDNTELDEIISSYSDKRIRYMKSPQKTGISQGRNKLIDLAKGEYLAVLDHDDVCLPTRLAEEAKVLDQHPKIGVVGCWVERFPDTKINKYPENNKEIEQYLMQGCAVAHTAAMIRKSVLKDIRYEDKYSPSEDYALWCRLIGKTQFYNIPKVLMKYRWHENNTSKTQEAKMAKAAKMIHAFARSANPTLWQEVCDHAPHVVRMKLFGLIPCGKFVQNGNKRTGLLKYLPFITTKIKLYLT